MAAANQGVRAPATSTLPDGARLHTIVAPNVSLRWSTVQKIGPTYVSEREYMTPVGPLAVTEREQTASEKSPQTVQVPEPKPTGTSTPFIDQGTTTNGGTYIIAAINDSNWLVELTIDGMVMTSRVPAGVPLPAIRTLLNSIS
jgi:hypothetical protein